MAEFLRRLFVAHCLFKSVVCLVYLLCFNSLDFVYIKPATTEAKIYPIHLSGLFRSRPSVIKPNTELALNA